MPQIETTHIPISIAVKEELERRKKILSRRRGRKASFDDVVRDMMGW